MTKDQFGWMEGIPTGIGAADANPAHSVWQYDAEHVLATNGHVLVIARGTWGRVPSTIVRDRIRDTLNRVMPGPDTVEPVLVDWPAFKVFVGPDPRLFVCETCGGAGHSEEKCEECYGDGDVQCECGRCGDQHEKKCEICDGTGYQPCGTCGGAKETDRLSMVFVAGVPFDRKVLARAVPYLDAPEVQYTRRPTGDDAVRPAVFTAADWTLIVMTLRIVPASVHADKAPRYEFQEA